MANELGETSVLVVDNPSEVRNTREMLRDLNFNNVSDMTSGLQVLTEIKKNPPGLVIVNFILPQYSGLQVFKSMRSDKALAVIKFILVVPKLNRREMEDLKNQGVEHILVRPFDSEQLREMIYDAFGLKAGDVKETAAALHSEGLELFNQKKWEEALKKFREASDAYPDPESYYMQGRAYLEMGMNDQAIAALQNALDKGARHSKVDHLMGVILQKKKDYLASVQALERAPASRTRRPTLTSSWVKATLARKWWIKPARHSQRPSKWSRETSATGRISATHIWKRDYTAMRSRCLARRLT